MNLTLGEVVKIFLILALSAYAGFAARGIADPEGARKVLENAGYTEITTGKNEWFACGGDGDIFNTAFTARTSPTTTAAGVVCRGFLLKRSTIRFNVMD